MKILFLTHRTPFPPDKGDRIRSYNLLRFLADRGDVYLGCLSDEPPSPETTAALQMLAKETAVFPVDGSRWLRAAWSTACGRSATEGLFADRRLRRRVEQWDQDRPFDVAVVFCSSMMQHVPRSAPPTLVDLVDVDSEKWLDYAATATFPRRPLYFLEGRRVRKLERAIGRQARLVALTTEPEAELYRSIAPEANIAAIGNGVDLEYFAAVPPAAEAGFSCVFVGALDYRANVESVGWFVEKVWPKLRERFPTAVFRIVGRRPSVLIRALEAVPGVEISPDPPDVRPFVARSSVSVSPLRIARGVQNKVLESMAMAKATVVSPQALTGLAAVPHRDLLVAATPGDWVEAVEGLWRDPFLRRGLGAAGRAFVESHHRWGTCLAPWAVWLDRVTQRALDS